MAGKIKPYNPFRWFDYSPEVIQLVVMLYVRYPLSLRNVELGKFAQILSGGGQEELVSGAAGAAQAQPVEL